MSDLIVKSAVRETLDDNQVSAEFFDALNEEVESLLEDAGDRAAANDRATVMPQDL